MRVVNSDEGYNLPEMIISDTSATSLGVVLTEMLSG